MPLTIQDLSESNSETPLFFKKISVCAWCKKIIKVSKIVSPGSIVSHGICQKCKIEFIDNNIIEKLN
jgi:hypothetical protein